MRFAYRMLSNKTALAGNKLSEFDKVMSEIRKRKAAGLANFSFASVRKTVFSIPAAACAHGRDCEILSISPSDADILSFIERVASMMPEEKSTKRSISSVCPNEVSVATVIKIGEATILLGADLENSGKQNSGWEGVLNSHQVSPFAPNASLFKIAHHGSDTAYNRDIWSAMVRHGAYSALTPWQRGRGRLPTPDAVRKILSHTDHAFTSALNPHARSRKPDRPLPVLRQLRESGVKLRSIEADFGAVRFRTSNLSSGDWDVEMFGDANHLSKFLVRPGRQAV
ncbi:MAG: hypothetical protein ACR650_02505 [Methylocystis sp.]